MLFAHFDAQGPASSSSSTFANLLEELRRLVVVSLLRALIALIRFMDSAATCPAARSQQKEQILVVVLILNIPRLSGIFPNEPATDKSNATYSKLSTK